MNILYNIHNREDGTATVVVYAGSTPLVADNTHTNFSEIVEGALDSAAKAREVKRLRSESQHFNANALEYDVERLNESIVALFDVTPQIAQKFENITERVSVANG